MGIRLPCTQIIDVGRTVRDGLDAADRRSSEHSTKRIYSSSFMLVVQDEELVLILDLEDVEGDDDDGGYAVVLEFDFLEDDEEYPKEELIYDREVTIDSGRQSWQGSRVGRV